MRKQLSFRRLTLFVLSVLFLAAVTVAGIGIGKSTQALADEASVCEHVLGEMHTVKAQTCVEPGIGVRYCKDCHGAFNVVIPADGVSHPKVNAEGECEVCGATGINYVIDQEKSTEDEIVVKGVPAENSDVINIVIPAKIGEKPVYVSENAFAGNEKIQSVEIQGSPFVGESAFEGCTNLSDVTIKDGTQTIASNAFKDCESLEKVDLPDSVTSVGADAFTGTKFYEDGWVNWETEGLKTLSSGHCLLKADAYAAPHGISLLSVEDDKSYMDDITVIADEAFAGLSDLAEVTLPDGIITIGFNAFKGTAVRSVILPASAQNIVGLNGEGFKIYYLGSTAEWEKIGAQVPQSDVYFYAADEKNTLADNNYWYYGEDNLPTPYIKLSGISFGKEPKKEYLLGEPFVFDGAVNADYVNGTSDEIPNDRLDIDYSEFKSNQTGSYKITISYAYCELEYTVTVTDAYIVTIDYGYNIPNGTASVEILKEGEASNYTLPAAPARTGYTFTGWLFNGETKPAETPVIVESNLTITAQWERLTPAITMDYVGGTWTENDGYTVSAYDEASDSYTVTITAEPTRTGYIFKGWTYALKDAEPADVENNTFTIKLADDMAYTVTAVWEARTPVITLNYAEGEEGTAEAAYGPLSEDSKYTVTVTGEPTRTGWKFIGWAAAYNGAPAELVADNGVYTYTFDLADEMTLALTAQWEQLYTVTVGTTEHAAVEIKNAQEYYETGTAVTFTVKADSGYKLSAVSVGTLGEDGVYIFNVEKANVTIDVTTEQVTVTVIVAGENASDENVKFTQDASAHFTLDALTRDGYTFNGWIVKVGENAASETPVNGSYELPLANSDVTVTFTADWTANDYHLFVEGAEHATVTYEKPEISTYHIGETVKFKVAANEGYVLDSVKQGEAVLQADEDGYYSVTFGAADITVTVQTTQKTVTLSDLSVTAQENNIVLSVKVAYTGYTEEQISAAQLKYGENSIGGTFAEEKLTYTLTPATLQKGNVFTLSVDGTVIAISVEINETVEIGPTTYTFSIVDGNLTLSTNEADIQYTVASVKLASEAENITLTVTLTITNGVPVHNATLTVGEASATAAVQENVLTFTLAAAELQNGALTLKVNGLSGAWGDAQVEGSPLILNQKEYALDNENGLTLTVTQLYTVTVNPVGEGGTAELTDGKKDYYKTGDSVTLTVTVNKGYKLVSVKNGESDLTPQDGTYTVEVGEEDITITVMTEAVNVTVNYSEAGYGVEAQVNRDDPAKATITIGTPSKEGYTFDKWTYVIEGGAAGDYSDSLVIDLENADVTVTFTAHFNYVEYTLTIAEGIAGNPQLQYTEGQKSTYHIGDVVRFNVTVDAGYIVTNVEASVGELTSSEDGIYTYTFGAASVTITVTTKVQKVFTGVYNSNIAGGVFDFFAKLSGFTDEELKAATLIIGDKELPVSETTTIANSDVQFKFNFNGITEAIAETALSLRIAGETYLMTIVDGGDWTASYSTDTLIYTLSGKRGEQAKLTVTAVVKEYKVTVNYVGLDEGDEAKVGEIVSVELDPQNETYTKGTEVALLVKVLNVTKYALNKVEATGCVLNGGAGVYDFTVGESDITITITLDRLYHVTVETVGDADASGLEYLLKPDAGYYKAGQEFELTVMLDEEVGYTLTVEATGADLLNSEEGIYTFTVGTSDVKITITVTAAKPMATGDVVFDFSKWTGASGDITANDDAHTKFNNVASTTVEFSVSGLSKVYHGNQSGGSRGNVYDVLKMGSGSANGTITLTFSKPIGTVTIVCQNWTTTSTNTITVNELKAQQPSGDSSELLTFVLTEKITSITITTTKQIFIDSIGVTFYVPTPEDLVRDALATIDNLEVKALGKVDLTQKVGDVTISWELKNKEELTGYGTFENGELNITKLPTDKDHVLQFQVTATLEGVDQPAQKEVTVTILKTIDPGTENDPLTVAEAIALAKESIKATDNNYLGGTSDPTQVYVKGYVIYIEGWDSSHNDWTKVFIADSKDANYSDKENAVQLYRLELDGEYLTKESDLVVGAEITVLGCLQLFNGQVEVSHNPATNANAKAVAYSAPEPTNEEKLAAALATLDEKMTIDKTTTLTAQSGEVTFSWSTDTELPEGVSFADNTITITQLPEKDTAIVFTVTASINGEEATKTVTVTVKGTGTTEPGGDTETKIATYNAGEVEDKKAISLNNGEITITFSKGSGSSVPKYYSNGVRLYGGNTITISCVNGKLKSIVLTYTGDKGVTADKGSYTKPNWTGEETTVIFTVASGSGNNPLQSIQVTYETSAGGGTTEPGGDMETKNATYSAGEVEDKKAISLNNGEITITFSKGSGSSVPKYYSNGVRLYGGNTITISCVNGKLKSIVLTYTGDKGVTADKGSYTKPNWTGEETTVVFTLASGSGNNPLQSIQVTYEMPSADEVQSDMEVVPAVYNGPVSTTPSDTAENSALWISLVSVGVVLLALGAVVVVFSLRKKSE